MYDAGKIIGGVIVFVALATSPLWYNAITASPATIPELVKPLNGSTRCVEDTAVMRSTHMDLLNEWRDAVVREGRRDYVSTLSGTTYDMSLSRTCMDCHSNKADFCDRCHDYLAVNPYCWDCHVEPKEVG
jgi:hypothetical protein